MSWKACFLSCALMSGALIARSQNAVGIGVVNPNKNAVLELVSPGNNQGLLMPRLTTAQRTASAFTSSLSSKENGLLVFDSDENKFYYWQVSQWQPVRSGTDLSVGSGITISGNLISTIPQDLQLTGSTLKITNNPSATPINLAAFTGTNTDDQTLTFDGATGQLSISRLSGGPQNVSLSGLAPGGTAGGDFTGTYPSPTLASTSGNNIVSAINNASTTNLINTNRLNSAVVLDTETPTGGTIAGTFATGLTLNNNSVTTAKIAPGTNGQILTTAGGVTTWATGASPSGAAGGDLSGTYPSPTITNDAITGAKILDGTISAADLAASAVTTVKIAPGTNGQVLTTAGGVATWSTGTSPSGAAGGDLSGTYPSPTITNDAITGAKILDGTISAADLAASAVTTVKIAPGTNGQVLTTAGGVATWSTGTSPSGAAGGDLSGTYPSPTVATNAITSAKINDGAIVNADVNASAAIDVSKLAPGTSGQVLTTSGSLVPQWAAPGGTTLLQAPGTRNLFAGSPIGTTTSGSDNAFYGAFAGVANTSGSWNVLIGTQAGQSKTTGDLNTIIGWAAGRTNTAHQGNTLIGAQAGEFTTPTGNVNTMVGEKAGWNVTDGTGNVMLGHRAGQNTTTGFFNVFVGTLVGGTNTVGTRLTLIGNGTDVSANNLNNAIAIGDGAIVNASNKVRIGNSTISVIEGQVAFTAASDKRLKMNIKELNTGLDFIMKLKPMSYQMKNLTDTRTNWGFLAQDIEQLVGSENAILTVGEDKDRTLGLRYTDFVAPLTKAVQEQQKEIEELKAKLSASQQQVNTLNASLETLKKEQSSIADLQVELEKIKKVLGMEANAKEKSKN